VPTNDKAEVRTGGSELAMKSMKAAAHTLDDQRDVVAGQLNRIAQSLTERAGAIPGGDPTTRLSKAAADQINVASDYVRTHDVEHMGSDLERFVRAKPVMALAVAMFIGLALGRILRK